MTWSIHPQPPLFLLYVPCHSLSDVVSATFIQRRASHQTRHIDRVQGAHLLWKRNMFTQNFKLHLAVSLSCDPGWNLEFDVNIYHCQSRWATLYVRHGSLPRCIRKSFYVNALLYQTWRHPYEEDGATTTQEPHKMRLHACWMVCKGHRIHFGFVRLCNQIQMYIQTYTRHCQRILILPLCCLSHTNHTECDKQNHFPGRYCVRYTPQNHT